MEYLLTFVIGAAVLVLLLAVAMRVLRFAARKSGVEGDDALQPPHLEPGAPGETREEDAADGWVHRPDRTRERPRDAMRWGNR